MRRALLYLSGQAWLRRWMETSRLAERFTSRFVAGASLEDGLRVSRRLAAEKILTTLDCLGENVTSLEEAEASQRAYFDALDGLASLGDGGSVSIKLTQFGLDLSEAACRENVSRLVERARDTGTRVEIDMESSDYTDRTLALVREMHARYGAVRAVIQAYLHRSAGDIATLCAEKVPVRLCKGAYSEPESRAFARKSEVDGNYVRLMKQLLDGGTYPAIASHDEAILDEALRHIRTSGYGPERFEFQMLYGIRRDLQRRLTGGGYRLRLYVPYGDAWYPYFMRRLAERPANLLFVARNVFRG